MERVTMFLHKVARIWGTVVLSFIAFLILGHILQFAASGLGFIEQKSILPKPIEVLGFIFFPLGFGLGLLLSYKKELLGGLTALLNFFLFNFFLWKVLGSDIPILDTTTIIFVSPVILYIASGFLGKIYNSNSTNKRGGAF